MVDMKPKSGSKAAEKPDLSAPVLSTPALCSVTVDGQVIKFDISKVVLEQAVDTHHVLRLTLRETGQVQAAQDFSTAIPYTSFLGKSISLTIKPQGGVVDAARELGFVGVVTQINLENSIDGLNVGTIVAHSPTIAMDGSKHNHFYYDQTAADIIGAVVRKHPLTVGTIDSTQGTSKFTVQYRETDYEFIMRLAGDNGLFAHYDGKEFRAMKAASGSPEELVWRESLGIFSLGLGTASAEFTADIYDYVQDKTFSQDTKSVPQKAALSQLSKTSPDASKTIYKSSGYSTSPKAVPDAQTLDRILQHDKGQALGRMITCTGQSIIPAVKVGHCVKVKGMGNIDGVYWVLRARHAFDESGQYHNTFVCTPVDIAYPQQKSNRPELADLQSAVVTDNFDPDKLGRIKVKFPWTGTGDSLWVRLAMPYAGKNHGWYSLPEIGSEVLVGFEWGSPDLPIALGGLYNKTAAPPAATSDKDNNIKLFQTRSGNQIVIDDADGKEKISIVTKDGSKMVMDAAAPSITIETKGDITLKGKAITLESQADIKIKAGGNMNLEATANMETKGGAQYKIEGMMVEVKGTPIKLN
jgi:type VI secretion system secreted protein VgrG